MITAKLNLTALMNEDGAGTLNIQCVKKNKRNRSSNKFACVFGIA